MMLFSGASDHLARVLKDFDIDKMSPAEALAALKKLQEKANNNL